MQSLTHYTLFSQKRGVIYSICMHDYVVVSHHQLIPLILYIGVVSPIIDKVWRFYRTPVLPIHREPGINTGVFGSLPG